MFKFKKQLTLAGILTALCSSAFAASFYLGPSLVLNNVISNNSSFVGLSPRFTVGYGGMMTDNFYLAGEVFGMLGSISISDNSDAGSGDSVKTTRSYGASIIPGIPLSDTTLLYGRLGVIGSQFTAPDKTVAGGQAGIGLGFNLTPDWSLRTEYSYTTYRSTSGIGQPHANDLLVGVIHKFG